MYWDLLVSSSARRPTLWLPHLIIDLMCPNYEHPCMNVCRPLILARDNRPTCRSIYLESSRATWAFSINLSAVHQREAGKWPVDVEWIRRILELSVYHDAISAVRALSGQSAVQPWTPQSLSRNKSCTGKRYDSGIMACDLKLVK